MNYPIRSLFALIRMAQRKNAPLVFDHMTISIADWKYEFDERYIEEAIFDAHAVFLAKQINESKTD